MRTYYTDGNWVWSADIMHYIEVHDYQLPSFLTEYIFETGSKEINLTEREHEIIRNTIDSLSFKDLTK